MKYKIKRRGRYQSPPPAQYDLESLNGPTVRKRRLRSFGAKRSIPISPNPREPSPPLSHASASLPRCQRTARSLVEEYAFMTVVSRPPLRSELKEVVHWMSEILFAAEIAPLSGRMHAPGSRDLCFQTTLSLRQLFSRCQLTGFH